MGKKISVEKLGASKTSDESEDTLDLPVDTDAAELIESVSDDTGASTDIDINRIIKSTGGIQAAVSSTVPMIDQIGSHARLEAQRASAMAMKEYRRQLQGIMVSMQGTIREEGVRLAEQICSRITTQIRQAVLLETEKKALNLVDEFVLGWQIEAESMSQDLMATGVASDYELPLARTVERGAVVSILEPLVNNEPIVQDKQARTVESTEIDRTPPSPVIPVIDKTPSPISGLKKQPETGGAERPRMEQSENEKKVVYDFATFIAQSKSPLKS